jgi:hypothetical protein
MSGIHQDIYGVGTGKVKYNEKWLNPKKGYQKASYEPYELNGSI